MRMVELFRQTGETKVYFIIRARGPSYISTGLPFLDHMLQQVSLHSSFFFSVVASGDVLIDKHHLVEDIGIVFGLALKRITNNYVGIARYSHSLVLMDEVQVQMAADLSGRFTLIWKNPIIRTNDFCFRSELLIEFLKATARASGIAIHFNISRAEEVHHLIEAAFKAFGRLLKLAIQTTEWNCLSTKGTI